MRKHSEQNYNFWININDRGAFNNSAHFKEEFSDFLEISIFILPIAFFCYLEF